MVVWSVAFSSSCSRYEFGWVLLVVFVPLGVLELLCPLIFLLCLLCVYSPCLCCVFVMYGLSVVDSIGWLPPLSLVQLAFSTPPHHHHTNSTIPCACLAFHHPLPIPYSILPLSRLFSTARHFFLLPRGSLLPVCASNQEAGWPSSHNTRYSVLLLPYQYIISTSTLVLSLTFFLSSVPPEGAYISQRHLFFPLHPHTDKEQTTSEKKHGVLDNAAALSQPTQWSFVLR